jgi:hypothetical protein
MRIATNFLLLSALTVLLSLPVQAQNGHGFGGGSSFGNAGQQMFNPAVVNSPVANPFNGFGAGLGTGIGGNPGVVAPFFQAPVPLLSAPGFYRLGALNQEYWRSRSGYFYPWGLQGGIGVPFYSNNQGQTQAQNPPVYIMLADMRQFLDDMKRNGRLNDADYLHLFHRVQDLQGKYDHSIAMNGLLDVADEDSIRKDVGQLGSEISHRVKPLSPTTNSESAAIRAGQIHASDNQTSKSGWGEDHY